MSQTILPKLDQEPPRKLKKCDSSQYLDQTTISVPQPIQSVFRNDSLQQFKELSQKGTLLNIEQLQWEGGQNKQIKQYVLYAQVKFQEVSNIFKIHYGLQGLTVLKIIKEEEGDDRQIIKGPKKIMRYMVIQKQDQLLKLLTQKILAFQHTKYVTRFRCSDFAKSIRQLIVKQIQKECILNFPTNSVKTRK